MTNQRPDQTAKDNKAGKQSLFGLLFNPHFGRSFSPLRRSTAIFLAAFGGGVCSLWFIAQDYPGLNDRNAKLSFPYHDDRPCKNVSFTKDGALKAGLFVAVLAVIVVGTFSVF